MQIVRLRIGLPANLVMSDCRLEKVDFSTSSTIGKSIGTILSIVGAFILTLYKGPQIMTSSSSSTSNYEYIQMQQSDWVVGGLLLTLDCVASSAFIIVQVHNYEMKI